MNILYLTASMDMGGVETNIVLLARELAKYEHKLTVASWGGSLVDDLIEAGGEHKPIEARFENKSAFLRDVFTLQKIIYETHPDIIHVFAPSSAFQLWLAGKLSPGGKRRYPVVSSVMGLQNSSDEKIIQTHIRNYMMTMGADRIFIIAPAIKKMLNVLPISRKRERLIDKPVVGVRIPERLSQDDISSIRAELKVAPGEKIVMTIGALEPRKSHELFVRSAARVLTKRRNVKFFIVGEGNLRNNLEKEISSLGLEANVKLLGMRKDVIRLLNAVDVCVKPGIVEGFIGITVLEAQSLHVPVVAFHTEDVQLAIVENETGLIVPAPDTEKMALAIETLLDDEDMAARLTNAGYERVKNIFSIQAVTRGLISQYEEEIQKRTSRL